MHEGPRHNSDVLYYLFIIVIGMIVLGSICATSYWIDTTIIQPAQRANIVNDPNRTIALRADFHGKLTEILTANANIQALAHKIENNQKNVSGYAQSQQYQDDQSELEGLITIHTNTISAYNEQAGAVDTRAWNDICMPHSIAVQTLDTSDLSGMLDTLHIEQQQLTAKDGIC